MRICWASDISNTYPLSKHVKISKDFFQMLFKISGCRKSVHLHFSSGETYCTFNPSHGSLETAQFLKRELHIPDVHCICLIMSMPQTCQADYAFLKGFHTSCHLICSICFLCHFHRLFYIMWNQLIVTDYDHGF